MRITNAMLFETFLLNLNRLQQDYMRYNEQLSSERRINRPSDDPTGITNMMALDQELVRLTRFGENTTEANRRLEATDSRLNEYTLAMTRTIELTQQAASDPTTGEGRRAIAVEIRSIQDQLKSLADANLADRYLFAGTRTTRSSIPSVPTGQVYSLSNTLGVSGTGVTGGTVVDTTVYQEDIYAIRFTDAAGSYEVVNLDDDTTVATGTVAVGAGSISFEGVQVDYNLAALPTQGDSWFVKPQYVYNGTDSYIELQVDENSKVIQNVPGSDVFGGSSGVPGGTVFDELIDLRMALLRNNTTMIGSELTTVNDRFETVSNQRASVGGRISNLRNYQQRSDQRTADLLVRKAEVENVDLAEVISKLVQTEGGIQAALQSGARLGQLNLFDFLS
jgi:flagellar hook-associated protein 3 FlgL